MNRRYLAGRIRLLGLASAVCSSAFLAWGAAYLLAHREPLTPVLLALATLWCMRYRRSADGSVQGALPLFRLGTFAGTLGFALLAGFTLILMYTGENPFIYFQF